MDAAGSGEPAAEGQEGKQEVSDDSDSGQVIIELDQSHLASPSDSEEDRQTPESPKKPELPECPQKPELVESPQKQELPKSPQNLELPESQRKLEFPEPPQKPDLPKSPQEPEFPNSSQEPELPKSPQEPKLPKSPQEPELPESPQKLELSEFPQEPELPESPQKPEVVCDKTAESAEYFDAVSDTDDIPDDDDAEPVPAQSIEPVAEGSRENAAHSDVQDRKDKPDPEDSGGCLSQSPDFTPQSATAEACEIADSVKHKDDSHPVIQTNSGAADFAANDSLVPENGKPSETDRMERETHAEVVVAVSESPQTEKPGAESSEEKRSTEAVRGASPEAASSALLDSEKEPPAAKEETAGLKSSSDLFAIADDVSDVSSEGEAPLSPVIEEDKPSAEQLSKEAAHQAEALAPLGAEPVSEPESGEDMGSDDSSPMHSPGYTSPVVVTSTSRISLGSADYGDARACAAIRSPRKSDSAIISDSASSIQPADRSDRLSLEDGSIIPATLSASDNKLDLSASMDMENISDDENIGEDNDSEDTSGEIEDEPEELKTEETVSSSTQHAEEEGQKASPGEKSAEGERSRRPIMIASLGDKQQVQTHFSEEQVELDYEDVDGEGEGDEGEIKPEDEDDGKEEGEDSDKDEGEIDDDDDCEEGEIKEPGVTKKPFIKPVCRFFQRGTCTWGLNCRFLHPGVNDKGNYQMIELPGQRWNGPGGIGGSPWGQEPPEEPIDLPPPPEVPPVESAWERGLRHAKEQIKKASQRKEQESNFEEKRLNLSVDEEREMNKENERRTVVHVPIVKDPYYDQAAFDEEEYYKQRGINAWQSGRYENFEVRYNRESYSPYREKEYYPPPPERYPRHFSPPVDKFGRHPRMETRPEPPYRPNRMEEMRAMSPSPPVAAASPPPYRRPADEWHDPWRRSAKNRSKSPKPNRRGRSRSRSRRGRRSLSDSSLSSDSRSGSRSSGSRSSRSRSYSSGSSGSRSRSPEPAPPGVERGDRNFGPPQGRSMDGPRSAVSVRGRGRPGGEWRGQDGGRQGFHRNRGGFQRGQHPDQRHRPGPSKAPERSFPPGYGYNRPPPGQGRPPERRIPPDALRPRKAHSASSSGSSRSRSRSRSRSGSRSGSSSSFSRSRSGSARSRSLGSASRSRSASSVSSHTSSSSSSSSGSADSDHLYRDLGGPSPKKKTVKDKDKEKDAGKPPRHMGPAPTGPRGERKHPGNPPPRRPGPPPGPPADHGPRPPRSDPRTDGRVDRPPPDARLERGTADRLDPPGRGARPDRPPKDRPDRPDHDRPQRSARGDRPDRMERDRGDNRPSERPDRMERGDRMERDRGPVVAKPLREQSSRPPPPSLQPKAKDPMKLIGLKANIKLSLVSKPGDKGAGSAAAGGTTSAPVKRRPQDGGEGPPAKRPALPPSPVKMPSEKAAKPQAGRGERARSPLERQPRSGSAAIPASLPVATAASVPLPPSPTKAPSSAKPRPAPAKPPHPPPAVSKAAAPQPVPAPSAAPPAAAPAPAAAGPAAKAKKSTTSRREELLKQLKAVEDAIARKKAKMQ
ncbi:uncharacterized protein LOC143300758 isoform X2 [Babylonia areolata]|uniref:uncharacterized protein LOC143300758 isoform X2 n=1 Tax=Babylonia areolata TaxID=304850 RepID=UPI003FD5D0EA